jgi:hypothetical protein
MTIEPDFFSDIYGKGQVGRVLVSDLAANQHGVVARRQLLDIGLTSEQVQYGRETGWLHSIFPGVYAVGHTRISGNGRWMAAVLAGGRIAFLSHRTAAAVHGMLRSSSPTAHVTVPATGRRKRRGILLHESADVAAHATRINGLPVTTVARTLLDLAADKDPLLERAIEEAEHLRLLDVGAIDLDSKRPGVRRLRRALRIYRAATGNERSEFERRVVQAIIAAGLPAPSVNVWLLGAERDLVWHDHMLVVELDGPWHRGTAARIRDPRRDATLQLHGYSVVRVPQHWFDTDPAGVIATIRGFLSPAGRTRARPGR